MHSAHGRGPVSAQVEDADAALAAGEEGVCVDGVEEERVRRRPRFRRRADEWVGCEDPVGGEGGEEADGEGARGREGEAGGRVGEGVGGVEGGCGDWFGGAVEGVGVEGGGVRGGEEVGGQDEGAEGEVGGGGEEGGAVG